MPEQQRSLIRMLTILPFRSYYDKIQKERKDGENGKISE
jgi:hypothetical protein